MLTDWSSTFLVSLPSPNESRFPINVGITSYVATTGEVIFIIILFHQDMFTIKPFHLTSADGKYYRRLQRSSFWSICRRRDRFYPQNCALHANQKFRWLHNWRNTGACVKNFICRKTSGFWRVSRSVALIDFLGWPFCSLSTNSTTYHSLRMMKILSKLSPSSAVWVLTTQTCKSDFQVFHPKLIGYPFVSRLFFCSTHSCRYEKAIVAMAKQRVTLEVLSYHATAPVEDASKLKVIFLKSSWMINTTSL